jgi:hypothetical protein
MEPEGSLSCSQGSSTGPYPKFYLLFSVVVEWVSYSKETERLVQQECFVLVFERYLVWICPSSCLKIVLGLLFRSRQMQGQYL